MSEKIREEIDLFVADLRKQDDKATWEAISARCKENFPDVKGVSLTANAIRKRYNAWVRESEGSGKSEGKKQGEEIMSPRSKVQLPLEFLNYVEDYIEEYVRPIIERVSRETAEKVFEEELSNLLKVPTKTSEGYLPAPPMPDTVAGTRRHIVQRGKLAGTVDAELLELFENERKERGYNVSRMLDVVLWNYFGIGKPEKPKMSFERSELSDNKA
jgi:hypothetical protein